MKKSLKRIFITSLLAISLLGNISAFAAAIPDFDAPTESRPISTRADEFIRYYRTYNGVKQYRDWNATRGYWVNDWTNCT